MSAANNGLVLRQGSKWDFRGAWFSRLVQTLVGAGALWMLKLIYAGVVYLMTTVPPMQAAMNEMSKRLGQLETNSAEYVKKTDFTRELSAAEMRVNENFTRKLNEQLKKTKVQTKENMNYAR